MTSLKTFVVLVVLLATYGFQGANSQRSRGGGSEHGGGGHSVSKRSFSNLLQFVPWVGKSRSEAPAPTDNPDVSAVESGADASNTLRSNLAKVSSSNSADQERHTVVKRCVGAQPAQDLRTLSARSLFSKKQEETRAVSPLVKGSSETVVIVQHPGPVSLKRILPPAAATTPPPPVVAVAPVVEVVPVAPAAPAVEVIPVVPAAPAVPVVAVPPPVPAVPVVAVPPPVPAVPAVVVPDAVIVPLPKTTTPAPAIVVEAEGSIQIAIAATTTPPPPVLIAARAGKAVNGARAGKAVNGARADTTAPERAKSTTTETPLPVFKNPDQAVIADPSLAPAESARNDPHSISQDSSIS